MSSSHNRGELPPVKKRSRFSSPPPQGFVRYELDDDDTDDDPDFIAELDAQDDDDDPADEDENAPVFMEAAEAAPPGYPGVVGVHFDVDDLDSTSGESDVGHVEQSVDGFVEVLSDGGGADGISGAGVGVNEEGEHEEEGGAVDDGDAADADDDPYVDDGNDSHGENAGPDDDYAQFLLALLSDQGDPPLVAPPDAVTTPASAEADPVTSDIADIGLPSLALDDDDDFDYLRESARVRDDPLEFRDDLHVSRKELVQLLFNSNETNLRRQTRNSKARIAQRTGRTHPPAVTGAVAPAPASSRAVGANFGGASGVVVAGVSRRGQEGGRGMGSLLAPQPGDVMPVMPPPPPGTYMSLPAHAMYQLQEQMAVYVQILTTVHAETKQASRLELECMRTAGQSSTGKDSEVVRAAERSEALIRRLILNTETSRQYHGMLERGMGRLKGHADKMLQQETQIHFTHMSYKSSVYNLHSLDLLEPFLDDCRTKDPSITPATLLQRFVPYGRPDVAQALRAQPQQRQYSSAASRPGWFAWTLNDDNLLAMTMAKYGSEFAEFTADLLPHRQEDDCQARVRYLSSRRCPDNPVKRQVMFIASPLNREEVELVRRGLEMYGRAGVENAATWKRIQRELLPGREWSHLQKLWVWRETRRKYKAKYRARANEKKKALRGSAARV